jgi:integrase
MLSQIKTIVKERKPELAPLSIKTHSENIHRIYTFFYPSDTEFDIEKLEDTPIELITEYINTKTIVTRKCYAIAMLVIKRYPVYTKYIDANNEQYKARVDSHIPSDRDIKSKITPDKINEVQSKLQAKFDSVWIPDKHIYTSKEFQTIRNYILFQLVSGLHIPPRRSLDWVALKINNVNTETDNYIDEQECVFTQYKTSYKYGTQRIHIPDGLYNLLQNYIRINPYEYLIPTNTGKRYHVTNFNSLLNEIMETDHGSGTNQFRKSYLQTNFGNAHLLKQTMSDMGSSLSVINSYVTNI